MATTLFVILTGTWFLSKTLPGTPFADEKLSEEAREQLFAKYGLDEPLIVQYFKYLGNVVQGDLGNSFYYNGRPVLEILLERAPISAFIGFQALVIGVIGGLLLGIIAALKHNSVLDTATTFGAVAGISLPSFVLAPLAQYWIAVQAGLLPIAFWEGYAHSILPSLTLSVFAIAIVARFIRAEMLEVFEQDYVTLAKSKGLSKLAVILKHVLRNALIPMVTVVAPLMIYLITGSLVVETVFAIPGIGELFVSAFAVSDYTMIIGITTLFSVLFVFALLIQDILYGVIDPRIRVAGSKE
jgi:oligopeptide transport system permease protein